jgi:hypothetical protein
MGTLHISLGPQSVEGVIGGLPSEARAFVRSGFAVLSRLSPDELSALVGHLKVKGGYELFQRSDRRELARSLGITLQETSELAAAAGLVFAAVTSEVDTNEFANSAVRADLLPADAESAFRRLVERLEPEKATIRQSMMAERIATELLPAFDDFDTTIDVRLSFEKDSVEAAIPVVIAYVTTDDRESRIWFQMQKRQVTELISKLEKVRAQLELAENWAKK